MSPASWLVPLLLHGCGVELRASRVAPAQRLVARDMLSREQKLEAASPTISDRYGFAVAGLGDTNGDGYADGAVGSHFDENPSNPVGAAYYYPGGPDGLDAATATRFVAVDADDLGYFGYAVAGLGDLDGDGYDDLVVGAPATSDGAAFVYLGGAAGPDLTTELRIEASWSSASFFGATVGGAGDLNGDGYAELVIGDQWDTQGGRTTAGAAWLYLGGAAGAEASAGIEVTASERGDVTEFGSSFGGPGDLDGDGLDDLVIGDRSADWDSDHLHTGAVYIYPGADGGIDAGGEQKLLASDGAMYDMLGYAVAVVGDLDGDGYDDVVAGANGDDDTMIDSGSIYVWRGGATGVDSSTEQEHRSPEAKTGMENFGASVARVGDLDGDGHADLLVGAMGDDDSGAMSGSVYLFYGGTGGLDAGTVQKVLASDGVAGGGFGRSVAGLGDVAGDGRLAVMVGAFEFGTFLAGAAYVYSAVPDVDGDGVCVDEDCADDDPSVGVIDEDGDGWNACRTDCDDGDATVYPGASEVKDGQDNDCDGHDETWDTDGDGLSDVDEAELGTNPDNTDTDGDGLSDGQEVANGTDPRSPPVDTGTGEPDAPDSGEPITGVADTDEAAEPREDKTGCATAPGLGLLGTGIAALGLARRRRDTIRSRAATR